MYRNSGGNDGFGGRRRPQSMFEAMMGSMQNDFFSDPFFRDPFGSFGSFLGGMPMFPTLQHRPFEQNYERVNPNQRREDPNGPLIEDPEDEFGSHSGPRTGPGQGSQRSGSGRQGFYYSSTFSSTSGPGGVTEIHHTTRDSQGNETVRVERRLGNRAQAVCKKRDATGIEHSVRELRNVRDEEADQFDEEWQRVADQTLGPISNRARLMPSASAPTNRPALTSSRRSEPIIEEISDVADHSRPVSSYEPTSSARSSGNFSSGSSRSSRRS